MNEKKKIHSKLCLAVNDRSSYALNVTQYMTNNNKKTQSRKAGEDDSRQK